MADHIEWSRAYARQANADFASYQLMQTPNKFECQRLQFLQMACEKLAKAHLCGAGADPAQVRTSHAWIAKTLPVILKQTAVSLSFSGVRASEALRAARQISAEIELLAPAVTRNEQRPDNCEYPWEDETGKLHSPLDWSFAPSELLMRPSGRTVLKLIRIAMEKRSTI